MSTIVGTLADFPVGSLRRVDVNGRDILVANVAGKLHAVDDTCTHAEVSLSEGELSDCTVECWMHGARFSLETGAALSPPASAPLTVHEIQVLADESVSVTERQSQ